MINIAVACIFPDISSFVGITGFEFSIQLIEHFINSVTFIVCNTFICSVLCFYEFGIFIFIRTRAVYFCQTSYIALSIEKF